MWLVCELLPQTCQPSNLLFPKICVTEARVFILHSWWYMAVSTSVVQNKIIWVSIKMDWGSKKRCLHERIFHGYRLTRLENDCIILIASVFINVSMKTFLYNYKTWLQILNAEMWAFYQNTFCRGYNRCCITLGFQWNPMADKLFTLKTLSKLFCT